MKKYLEYQDQKSHKFWELTLGGSQFTVTYGKVSTKGQSKVKTFETEEIAEKEAKKLVQQKIKKGYQEKSSSSVAENLTEKEVTSYELPVLNQFQKLLHPITLSKSFIELVKFDAQHTNYVTSFYIENDNDDYFESWLDYEGIDAQKRKEYSQSMIVFAGADGTGAVYAFWLKDGISDLDKVPIICYGSEGAIEIVAENLSDLIKMLSLGAEGMDGSFGHYVDDDPVDDDYDFFEEFLEYHPDFLKFRTWMGQTLDIKPVKNWQVEESKEIEKLQKRARKLLQKPFDDWQYQFYPDPNDKDLIYQKEQQQRYDTTKAKLLKKAESQPTAAIYMSLAENEQTPEETDFEQLRAYQDQALEFEPDNIENLKLIAKGRRIGKAEQAIPLYEKLLEIDRVPAQYYSDIAYAYMRAKDLEKALDNYTKDIRHNRDGYGEYSQNYIVKICKELKGRDSIQILEDSLSAGHSKATYKILYQQYFRKKNYTQASKYALAYIEHSDEQAHNYTTISDKFMKKKAFEEALPILENTLDRHDWDSRKLVTYNDIGLCYLRIDADDTDKALNAFKEGYKLDAEEGAFHENIALCGDRYIENEDFEKAIQTFQFCLDHKLLTDIAFYNIGVCYRELKKFDKSLAFFEKALKEQPENEHYQKLLKKMERE